MMKKYLLFFVTLFMMVSCIRADRLDDAVNASNYEDVNYLLVMKGNAVSQHRKDELVLLANEVTLQRKRGAYPLGNVWDNLTTAKGILASAISYKCVRVIVNEQAVQHHGEFVQTMSLAKQFYAGLFGSVAGIVGLYYLINGLRSAHGRDLYAQAQQIEKRINELQVAGSEKK